MLSVGDPMRNTEYSSRFSDPVLAPTIRSTPDTVLAKLSRACWRICSIPSSTKMATLMAISVMIAEPLRLIKLLTATFKNMVQQGLCVMSDSASRRVKCSESAMS